MSKLRETVIAGVNYVQLPSGEHWVSEGSGNLFMHDDLLDLPVLNNGTWHAADELCLAELRCNMHWEDLLVFYLMAEIAGNPLRVTTPSGHK